GYFDVYPNPSATAQSALAARMQASVSVEHRSDSGARTGFSTYLVYNAFRLRENFTGFTERSQQRPKWVGRGDLIEQGNRGFSIGGRLFHRSPRYEPRRWLSAIFEAGLDVRSDIIDQEQNLLQEPQNETWDKRVDASIRGADVGLYADADIHLTRYL